MGRTCYQLDLQATLGGGEVYARFLTAALSRLGWRSVLLVARDATFWPGFMPEGVELRPVWDKASIMEALPKEPSLIITHTVLPEDLAPQIAASHRLTGMVHMPLYEREPRGLTGYHRLFAVSEHVRASALAKGLRNVHPEPLYGVADLQPRSGPAPVRAASPYEWDERKMRDRLLGWVELHTSAMTRRPLFQRPPGLCLGIVSRLTPIKQFPEMFSILAPLLARDADVHLEIFGAGGYASVRDLRRALAPARKQVRFWGLQTDVAAVYPQLDYVLSGLPEKEALGLNIIESQLSGTPVLAVRAPPFTETVVDGATGYLFEDPRKDGGRDFAQLLERIRDPGQRPDPRLATEHLARFSLESFSARVERALTAAMQGA
jgi:glycosyltransferase involved in cell wall biosynthesis